MQHLFVGLTPLGARGCLLFKHILGPTRRGGNAAAAARGRLTDELVLHSLQQRLVGIFGLHGSGAFPRQHGAYQMLSAACGGTKKHTL